MSKCYHQRIIQYDSFIDPSTDEEIFEDFEVCKDCNAVIHNDKVIGYDTINEEV